jgi:hypothetical protein
MNKEKIYKAVMVPEDLHQQIKVEATTKKMTIIEFINFLMYGKDKQKTS